MKTRIFYFLVLVSLFLCLCDIRALETKKHSTISESYQKIKEGNPIVSYDSQNSPIFFDVNFFDEDDDDIYSLAKKKIFHEGTSLNKISPYSSQCLLNNLQNKFSYYIHFSHLPASGFISLKVLRL